MMIGQQLGPFRIESELGSGAMGTVYKATFQKDETEPPVLVALKVVSMGLLSDDKAMARFDREAAILKQLRHPHIVRLLATGRHRKTPFIAMEYVDGESLDRTLTRRNRLDWETVAQYGKQLCDALQHAHVKGIVHRDLKPSNLMVTRDGTLKLTDFGIAKDTDVTALTGANSTIGTAAYMSPEQCRGDKTLGPKSDLYSLGVVFYELLTGKKPFVSEGTVDMFLKHVNETPVRPRRHVPDLPIWVDNLVMFLLEKNKESRPADAATVGVMLADIEQKVQSQQSVGAEVANARRVDRQVSAGPLAEGDREAARSLRQGGTKKKKKKPKGRAWLRPTLIGVPLAVTLAVGGYFAFGSLFKAESPEAAYAKVEAAGTPETRLEAVTAFLAAHNAKPGPAVEKGRALFADEQARATEAALTRRHNTRALRNNTEGFDPDAYKAAMEAIDAEAAGDLAGAASLWGRVKEATPAVDTAKLPAEEEVARVKLGWVAERRLKLLRETVPQLQKKWRDQLAQDRLYELPRNYDPTTLASLAARADALEATGDGGKARALWKRVATQTESDADNRAYQLIAAQKLALLPADKEDAAPQRLDRLTKRLEALEADAKAAEADPNPGPKRRTVRNGCRELLALYDDEPGAGVKALLARAQKLLDSLPKS